MIKVTIIKRKSRAADKKGIKSLLYLSFSPALFNPITMKTIRFEAMGLDVYDRPKTPLQNKYNKDIYEKAEAIRCQRQLMVINDEYGFVDKSAKNADFLEFFRNISIRKGGKCDASYKHFKAFVKGKCTFANISVMVCEKFRDYLLDEAICRKGSKLSNNTAAMYYMAFRSVLKEAYRCRLLKENINDYLDKIPENRIPKPYLTLDEVKRLARTPCHIPVMKHAAMFSIMTGLRISDILTLEWEHITTAPDGGPCIVKVIQKSRRLESIPISEEALTYCGERGTGLVFNGLSRQMIYSQMSRWIASAGITKHISFHIFRHTHATLLVALGNSIYTVSKMLTHQNVGTTQIYAEVVDPLKRDAANSLTLK